VLNLSGATGAYLGLAIFFVALAVAAFVAETWAFVDAITRPAPAFVAAGKQTKPIWLIILGVAFVLGLYTALYGGVTQILAVVAFVAAAIYLVDVRPKVREFRGSRGTQNGPYGPW
jgi:predicted membrane metal-binding protein